MAKEPAKKPEKAPGEKMPVRRVPAVPVEGEFDRFIDRMFDDFRPFRWPSLWPERWPFGGKAVRERLPAVDVYEEKDDVVVKAEIPGMSKNDIEVSVTDSTLTIKGEKKKEEEIKEGDYYRWERSYGSFSRSVDLPTEVKSDRVKASLKDGVLQVRLPKTEHAKRKRVAVTVE